MANKKELSLFKQMQRKTDDYDGNLSVWIIGEEREPNFSVPLKNLLTAQKEINSIVQKALKNESLNKKEGGRRTRGKLRAKSRKKRRKSRRKSKGRKRRRKNLKKRTKRRR